MSAWQRWGLIALPYIGASIIEARWAIGFMPTFLLGGCIAVASGIGHLIGSRNK